MVQTKITLQIEPSDLKTITDALSLYINHESELSNSEVGAVVLRPDEQYEAFVERHKSRASRAINIMRSIAPNDD